MKSNKTVKIIIFTALFLSAVILISVMTGAVKETTADTDSVKLPVIMYHSLLKDEKLQNDYTVSPTLFENDLKYSCRKRLHNRCCKRPYRLCLRQKIIARKMYYADL